MVTSTKGSSKMGFIMDKEFTIGQVDKYIRELIKEERNMDSEL